MALHHPNPSITELKEAILEQVAYFFDAELDIDPGETTHRIIIAREDTQNGIFDHDVEYYAVVLCREASSVDIRKPHHSDLQVAARGGRSGSVKGALELLLEDTQKQWHRVIMAVDGYNAKKRKAADISGD